MRASLYLADADPNKPGYMLVATLGALGKVAIHAAPGMPPLAGMKVVKDGARGEWTWMGLWASDPAMVEQIVRASWLATADKTILALAAVNKDGLAITQFGTVADARARGLLATAVTLFVPPHHWAGDSEG